MLLLGGNISMECVDQNTAGMWLMLWDLVYISGSGSLFVRWGPSYILLSGHHKWIDVRHVILTHFLFSVHLDDEPTSESSYLSLFSYYFLREEEKKKRVNIILFKKEMGEDSYCCLIFIFSVQTFHRLDIHRLKYASALPSPEIGTITHNFILTWIGFRFLYLQRSKKKRKKKKKRRNRFHSLRWVDPDWPFMKWCATISYYQRYYIPWPSIRAIEEKPEWWKQMTVKNLTRIAKGQQKRIDESQRGRWISECDGVLQGTCLMVFYLSFRLLYSFLHKRTKWT
jgi:hypothetical protein